MQLPRRVATAEANPGGNAHRIQYDAPHQKRSILLEKCFRSMMLGLGANVCPHVIKLRLATVLQLTKIVAACEDSFTQPFYDGTADDADERRYF